jgi:hypothetical protein
MSIGTPDQSPPEQAAGSDHTTSLSDRHARPTTLNTTYAGRSAADNQTRRTMPDAPGAAIHSSWFTCPTATLRSSVTPLTCDSAVPAQ